MQDYKDRPVCSVCSRLHSANSPCPRRIANAVMQLPKAVEQLTDSDEEWMNSHAINTISVLEEHIAELITD